MVSTAPTTAAGVGVKERAVAHGGRHGFRWCAAGVGRGGGLGLVETRCEIVHVADMGRPEGPDQQAHGVRHPEVTQNATLRVLHFPRRRRYPRA